MEGADLTCAQYHSSKKLKNGVKGVTNFEVVQAAIVFDQFRRPGLGGHSPFVSPGRLMGASSLRAGHDTQ